MGAYNIEITDSSMQFTGDDAYAFWQGQNDQRVTVKNSNARYPGIRASGSGALPHYGFGSCMTFFGCHEATIEGFTCHDRKCDDGNSYCTDAGQGHLIVFYPPNVFNGKYEWGSDSCVVKASDLWWEDSHKHKIEFNEHFYSNIGNRDWLSRCKGDYNNQDVSCRGQWNGVTQPWVCYYDVDVDDQCKWIYECETTNVGAESTSAVAAAVTTTAAAAATTTTVVGVTDKGRVDEYSLYVVLVSLTISILVKYAKEGKRSEGYAVLVDVQ